METKDTRRKRKLGLLIAATDGGLEAIAIKAEINPAYLQQIVKGVLLPPKKDGTRSPRALGDSAAEKIEDAYKLGRGWFDSPQVMPNARGVSEPPAPYAGATWPFKGVSPDQWARLSPESCALVEAMALQLLAIHGVPSSTKQTAPATRNYA